MSRYILFVFLLVSPLSVNAFERIYAIMVTGKDASHYEMAKLAIESFLEQTYPNKELIIINDGDYHFETRDGLIKEIHLKEKRTLGELRNVGLDAIPKNALWIQWDDDDWRHPELIQRQYQALIKSNAQMVYLKNQVQYSFKKNAAWKLSRRIEGTILSREKPDVRYPSKRKAEDSDYYKKYSKKYRTVAWNNPAHYYLRFIHGHNTWDEDHFNLSNRKQDEWLIEPKEAEYLSLILPKYAFI